MSWLSVRHYRQQPFQKLIIFIDISVGRQVPYQYFNLSCRKRVSGLCTSVFNQWSTSSKLPNCKLLKTTNSVSTQSTTILGLDHKPYSLKRIGNTYHSYKKVSRWSLHVCTLHSASVSTSSQKEHEDLSTFRYSSLHTSLIMVLKNHQCNVISIKNLITTWYSNWLEYSDLRQFKGCWLINMILHNLYTGIVIGQDYWHLALL